MNVGRTNRWAAWGLGALLLLAGGRLAPAAEANSDAMHRFMWDRANARMCSALNAADFAQAAALYHDLILDGVRNGSLFYNYGLALLKAEHYPEAQRALARAERYTGSSPELRQTLLAAMDKSGTAGGRAVLPWYRVFLFWHFDLDLSTRLAIALTGFSLVCLSLAMRLWNWRNLARQLHVLGVALLILFGSSVGASLHAEARDQAWEQAWRMSAPSSAAGTPAETPNASRSP